jgi:hypothetical protein
MPQILIDILKIFFDIVIIIGGIFLIIVRMFICWPEDKSDFAKSAVWVTVIAVILGMIIAIWF